MASIAWDDRDVEALVLRLAPAVAEAVAAAVLAQLASPKPAHPEWADRYNNPYKSARAFLDAARRGEFPRFIHNRRVTAVWVDVERAIEQRGRRHAGPATAEVAVAAEASEPAVDIEKLVRESRPRRRRAA